MVTPEIKVDPRVAIEKSKLLGQFLANGHKILDSAAAQQLEDLAQATVKDKDARKNGKRNGNGRG